jgi:Protein of unknown function (DUF4232)
MPELKDVFDKITDRAEPDTDSWKRQEKLQHRSVRNRKLGAIALSAALIAGLATAFVLTRPNGKPGPATGGGNPAAVQRCVLGDLKITAGRSSGAAGSIGGIFILENTSAKTCTLEGYPGMQMLDAKGNPITTHVIRGSSVVVPAIPVTLVKVAPGVRVSFRWGYSDVSSGPGLCPTSTSVEITPPNDYNHVTLAAAMSPCGGKITVSPVRPGTKMP